MIKIAITKIGKRNKTMDKKKVGQRIKKRRLELEMTQNEVKNKADIASSISEMENGISLPSAESLLKLAKLFQVSVDWILTGSDKAFLDDEKEILIGEKEMQHIRLYRGLNKAEKEFLDKIMELLYQEKQKKDTPNS